MKKEKTWAWLQSLPPLFFAVLLLVCLRLPAQAAGLKISEESCTIAVGETYKLSVTVDGTTASATWGSSDSSVATVSTSGQVTGKAAGSAVITATVDGSSVECLVSVLKNSKATTYRYNVLILDTSGSMKGKPRTGQKNAALRFCKKVLGTSGKNYVAVVTLNSKSSVLCEFTNKYSTLKSKINSISANGKTNMNAALKKAGSLLSKVSRSGSNVMKNIVLCSDGLPTYGSSSKSGRYTKSNNKTSYAYANTTYKTASRLKKKGYFIYALGFFHSSTGKDLSFGKKLMKDLASKDKYYIIQDTADLDDVFDTIATQITTATISKSSITIKVSGTYQLYAYVNGKKTSASWSSSKSSIATVSSSGKVTGKKAGTATITAKVNGKKVTCKVKVKASGTLKLNKSKVTLYVGDKMQLTTVKKNISGKVTWKSSNTSVATVSTNGVVTAKKKGAATITASADGVSVKCKVTVKKATHPPYSMYFTFDKVKMEDTDSYITECGMRLVLNGSAVVEKCGACVKKNGNYWEVLMAFKGSNVTSALLSCYVSYKGEILYDGATNSHYSKNGRLNSLVMKEFANGVWYYNRGQRITFNIKDITGKLVTNVASGVYGKNTKIFTDSSEMIKWLKS